MVDDLKAAVRQFRREVRFTTAVVLILSLAAGANLAGFTLVNAVLIQPLPYREPDRLVRIWESNPSRGIFRSAVSRGNYADWRHDAKSFGAIEAFDPVPRETLIQFGAAAELARVAGLTDGFMRMLGVPPLAGTEERGYRMSYSFLQRRFGGVPGAVLGRNLIVEGFRQFPVPITAVMPRGFDLPTRTDLWSPLSFGTERADRDIHVVARLRPGVSLAQAQAEMDMLSDQLARAFPAANSGWRAELVPLAQTLASEVRPTLLVVYLAVCLFLLIAAVNVATLFLTRRIQRQKDVSIQLALGATHGRIIRQAIAYCAVLATTSIGLGLGLAALTIHAIVVLTPVPIPRSSEVTISWPVLVAAVVLAATVAAMMVTLAAARSRVSLDNLRTQSDGGSGSRTLRSLLLVSEVACCSCLLLIAVLSVRAFLELQHARLGFESSSVLAIDVRQPISKAGEHVKHYPTRRFLQTQEAVVDYVRDLSGVSAVGVVSHSPLARPLGRTTYRVLEHAVTGPLTGTPPVSGPDSRQAGWEIVDSGFFRSIGVRLLEGRTFSTTDRLDDRQIDDFDADRGTGVAIVSREFAREHWPGTSPIGKFLAVDRAAYRSVRIVGVADDVVTTAGMAPVPTIYLPYAQSPVDRFTLLVRSTNPEAVAPVITSYMRQKLDGDVIAFNEHTYDSIVASALARPRFSTYVMSIFAVIATGLTALALYSVLSFVVTLRRRELAIRVALGASPRQIVTSLFGEGALVACMGTTAGLASAVVLIKVLRTLLSDLGGVTALDMGFTAALVLLVAAGAIYGPAKRAGMLGPVEILRGQ